MLEPGLNRHHTEKTNQPVAFAECSALIDTPERDAVRLTFFLWADRNQSTILHSHRSQPVEMIREKDWLAVLEPFD